jgi:Nif-specific regulatory protein
LSAAVGKLAAVCREVLPGLQRALLRHWMQQIGAPVDVVGRSPAFLELERQIRQAGSCADGSVLVTGERGSGKEVVAWAIHAWSRRRSRPFVPLLAAACSDSMTADELFGHERNSFTGAAQSRPGKFQAADGGTLMLDEAGDLPAPIQASFLRVLESGELQRIGRDETLRVNVRVVAATNRDLSSLMAEGRFRRDLYDRLSFFEIKVPSLRERSEDIPLLARHFLRSTCPNTWRSSVFQQEGVCGNCCHVHPASCATQDFFAGLQAYSWPGNVRELRHVVGRMAATFPDEALGLAHLPEGMQSAVQPARSQDDAWSLDGALRRHIENVLRHTGSNQSEAARLLGLPLSTLRSKMKRLGMSPLPPR